jgi:hypothetical protein
MVWVLMHARSRRTIKSDSMVRQARKHHQTMPQAMLSGCDYTRGSIASSFVPFASPATQQIPTF